VYECVRCDILLVSEPEYHMKAYVVSKNVVPHIHALVTTVVAHFMVPCVTVHCCPLQNDADRQLPLYRPRHQLYALLSSSVLLTHVSAVLRQNELSFSQYKDQIKILQPRYLLPLTPGASYVVCRETDCQISLERYVGLNGENLPFCHRINNCLHLYCRWNTVLVSYIQ
jgi:hypothetical protein